MNPTATAGASGRPLAGVRIVDLTQNIAGPVCSQTLGDLGAEVVKVEPLTGDAGRHWGTWRDQGRSFMFFCANRNKQSIALDVSSERGAEVLDRLVAPADVVLTSMSFEAAERNRLTHERFVAVQPTVITCNISGYGSNTPRRYERAYDQMLQAEVGIMAMGCPPGGVPGRLPISAIDILAANAAATAIAANLAGSPRSACAIDVPLYGAAINLLSYWVPEVSVTHQPPSPDATRFTLSSPIGVYRAQDGYLSLGVGTDRLWSRFCDAVGLGGAKDDPRFASNSDRVDNRAELDQLLTETFARRGCDEWVALLRGAGIPVAKIEGADSAVESDFANAHEFVLPDPDVEGMRTAAPITRSGPMPAGRHVPLLGEHTREILRSAGYDDAEIQELLATGVAVDHDESRLVP